MSKLSDRLNDYQTQMSIYAEQHKIILANDVLDMIEQLQEDLEDDIEKVVAELEEESDYEPIDYDYCDMSCSGEEYFIATDKAIDIVRKGCAE